MPEPPAEDHVRGRILVIDDEPLSASVLRRILELEGHHVDVSYDCENGAVIVREIRPDVVFVDLMMPKRNGIEICRELKQSPDTLLTPVVLVTASSEGMNKIAALNAGADDFMVKPLNPSQVHARVKALLRHKSYTDDVDSAASMLTTVALTVEARDPSTAGHCQRLASLAEAIGRAMNLDSRQLAILRRGCYLHDVGKIELPDAVLLKQGRLTTEEFELVKQHPLVGDRLCAGMRSLADVRPIVRWHHERLDGSGYPDGLMGDGIPLLAAITALVDVFDALTTARPYKEALTNDGAANILREEVRRGLHRADLVNVFLEIVFRDNTGVRLGELHQ